MKFVAPIAIAVAMASLAVPSRAEEILIQDTNGYCKRFFDTQIKPKRPKLNEELCLSSCKRIVEQSNACVRRSGWNNGQPLIESARQCKLERDVALEVMRCSPI